MHFVIKKAEVYNFEIRDINREFKFNVEVYKVEKEFLLEIPNPNYGEIQKPFYRLRDVILSDVNTKKELSVDFTIGTGDYTESKTQETNNRIPSPASCRVDRTRLDGNFSRQKKYCSI